MSFRPRRAESPPSGEILRGAYRKTNAFAVFGTGNCSIQDLSARSLVSLAPSIGMTGRGFFGAWAFSARPQDDRKGTLRRFALQDDRKGLLRRVGFSRARLGRQGGRGPFLKPSKILHYLPFYIYHLPFSLYMQGKAFRLFILHSKNHRQHQSEKFFSGGAFMQKNIAVVFGGALRGRPCPDPG